MKQNFDPIIKVDDDRLAIPEVRIWSLEKYQLLGGYCDIFTKGMKSKWDNLVYIDLYAGAGYSKIRETKQILKSSSLIAASIPVKFDKYLFCEQDPVLFNSLKRRVERDYSQLDIELFNGDSNILIDDVRETIPKYSKGNTVLSFSFVDPFDTNVKFTTIKSLANDLVDFLILQALHMDANRNFTNYLNENSQKIANYLGNDHWRDIWKENKYSQKDFIRFLADEYDKSMESLGYLPAQRHAIKIPNKNVPLYYLTFYSKHRRGLDFFEKVDNYSTPQLKLGI